MKLVAITLTSIFASVGSFTLYSSQTSSFCPRRSRHPTHLHAEKPGMTTLHFKGKETFRSDPVRLNSTTAIQSFFQQEADELRKMLLSGSGNNAAKILSQPECISMKQEWAERARNVGGKAPDLEQGDVVCRVNTGGMNFVGLEVKSEAMIGTKLVFPDARDVESTSAENDVFISPEYQLTFIKDIQKIKGPMLLVWIFNRLTGQDGKQSGNEDGKKEQAVTSFSRFFAEQSGESEATFVLETSLDIAINFPSMLLKILPVSKEKAEEQGSASVTKTLVKDTAASLERIAKYYVNVQKASSAQAVSKHASEIM
jgi:hypothetical protein